MRSESDLIGVMLGLLSVECVLRLSMILSKFVLDIKLIEGYALVVSISCFSGEFYFKSPMKDYDR